MWLAWTVFSIIQIGSKRWFSSATAFAYYAHIVGGALVSLLSIGAIVLKLQNAGWKL
jgi:hypothetical protein